MDVLLIQPPTGSYRRDDRCQSRVEDQTIQVHFPPMDLAHHAAVLERDGFECAIRDYSTAGTPLGRALEEIGGIRPKMVFFSSTQPTQANDLAFAQRIKDLLGEVTVVLRGESVTFQDQVILSEYPQVDFILRGESEETLSELASLLLKAKPIPLEEIAGLSFRGGGMTIRTPDRPFIKDLNRLPWPARHLLDQSLYRSPETGNTITTLYAARGCPYPCIFCPAPLASGRPVRLRAVSDLLAEIRHCVEEYGIREFLFHGDTFTYSREWVLELCRAIEEAGLRIRWGCNSRVDTIDPEMLRAMKRAGCWVIGFGVESGHEETLKRVRKAVKREKIVEAFRMCREAGIRSHAFFVFGFPWETEEHLAADLVLAREIDPDFFDFNIAYPLPGTELLAMVQNESLYHEERVDQGGYAVPATRTHALSAEELDRWRRKALLSLYLRPSYIARTLWLAGSPRKTFNYIRAGARRLRQLLSNRRSSPVIEEFPADSAEPLPRASLPEAKATGA
ncbi:MAG: radical SAM protein [Candidatus Omnitrophica bacterium]|nr:radical SAM protein [Candidatus Omnitrophota bacterium]